MDYQMHQRIMVWLEMAGAALRKSLDSDLIIEEKMSPKDLVTQMDKQIETFFVDKINTYYPEHRIIGEEGIHTKPSDTKGIIWIVDPIDGTMNFIKQKRNFGIMIGIYEDGEPLAGYIYEVMKHEVYYGIVGVGAFCNNIPLVPYSISNLGDGLVCGNSVNFMKNVYRMQVLAENSLGVRSYGASALEIIAVIRGEASAYFSVNLKPWDYAAGYAICEAMGMKATTRMGEKPNILEESSMVFAPEHIHKEIMEKLNNL